MACAPGRAQGRNLARNRNCRFRFGLRLGRRRLVLVASVRERRLRSQHRPDRQQSQNARSHGRILVNQLSVEVMGMAMVLIVLTGAQRRTRTISGFTSGDPVSMRPLLSRRLASAANRS